VTIAAVNKADQEIDDLTKKLKDKPGDKRLQDKLTKATNKKNSTYDELSDAER